MSITWNVSLIPQPDPDVCWDACARMMWHWRHMGMNDSERKRLYRRRAGRFASISYGIYDHELDTLARNLGMRHAFEPELDLFRELLEFSPVMFSLSSGVANAHAVVAVRAELDPVTGSGWYDVADPCVRLSPSSGTCEAGWRSVSSSWVEADIGNGYIWYWP